jgi:hypothetical protein
LFTEALAQFDRTGDPLSQFQYAYTMEGWASVEAVFGSLAAAREKLTVAEQRYQAIAPMNDDAKAALGRVRESLARLASVPSQSP